MDYQVKFIETTQMGYDSLPARDAGGLYFTRDTRRLYKGDSMYASELNPQYGGNGEEFSDWTVERDGEDVTSMVSQPVWAADQPTPSWSVHNIPGDGDAASPHYADGDQRATSLSWEYSDGVDTHAYTASREQNAFAGYVLAGQSGMPLAAESETSALRSQMEGKASNGDVELTERALGEWVCEPSDYHGRAVSVGWDTDHWVVYVDGSAATASPMAPVYSDPNCDYIHFDSTEIFLGEFEATEFTAARSPVPDAGYVLGLQTSKPLASEHEAEELRTHKADKVDGAVAGDLAALDANGNPTDSGMSASGVKQMLSTALQPVEELWWDDPSQYDGLGGATAPICFYPRAFDMLEGGSITSVNIHTANSIAVDANVYIKLMSGDGTTTYATSDTQSLNVLDGWVTFTFDRAVPLSRDVQYRLVTITADTESTPNQLRVTLKPNAGSNDLYFVNTSFRPHMTVRWLVDMNAIRRTLYNYGTRIAALEAAIANN